MEGDLCNEFGCNKKAIGYYATMNWGKNLCEKHAPKEILELKEGEELVTRNKKGFITLKYKRY